MQAAAVQSARAGQRLPRSAAVQCCARVIAGLAVLLALAAPGRAELPQDSADRHLGVASCASAQCHGAIRRFNESNVRRNEYRTWSREDAHAKAYAVLRSKASAEMAQKLGLPNAHEARVCLDCHADNVAPAKRGGKFQLTDGVGCEACHGGSERWIESHTEKNVSHADNVAKGMYPTEDPARRAELCLSCHYGDRSKFATHDLMAAGHPRLAFELDTFSLTQVHYDVDADYRRRKNFPGSVETWAAGVARTAEQNLAALKGIGFARGGLFPEIAFFDCHACHHPMKDKRWRRRAATAALPAGAIRLNDSALQMLYVIGQRVAPDDSQALFQAILALHRATLGGRNAVLEAADKARAVVQRMEARIAAYAYTPEAIRALRASILAFGGRGEWRDYSGAEQATMAVDLLTFALREEDRFKSRVDGLYAVLADETEYRPTEFAGAMQAFAEAAR